MNGNLVRVESGPNGTFGLLEVEGLRLHTIELPWRFNLRNVSCIPVGAYSVIRWESPSKGDCFKVLDVPDRDDILIHSGNTIYQFQGCIGVGRDRGYLDDMPAVLQSRAAMGDLRAIAPDGFTLTITEDYDALRDPPIAPAA